MKFNVFTPDLLKQNVRHELRQSKTAFADGAWGAAWRHLERAHILGQSWPIEHTVVHWRMFIFGVKIRSWHECIGQIPRLLVGGVKSFVGKVPLGNTGGANVPPLKPMPVPDDLAEILSRTR